MEAQIPVLAVSSAFSETSPLREIFATRRALLLGPSRRGSPAILAGSLAVAWSTTHSRPPTGALSLSLGLVTSKGLLYRRITMGFSDKMREGLGAEGARLSLQLNTSKTRPGGTFGGSLRVAGGTKSAQIDAFVVRLIQARRQWRDEEGNLVPDSQIGHRPDRSRMEPVWERSVVHEQTIRADRALDPNATEQVDIELRVPEHCTETTVSCTYMMNVQAQIRGQIDPSTNANVVIEDGSATAPE